MTIWDFIANHYFYTFLLGIFTLMFVSLQLRFLIICWKRLLRCVMVRKHGWPPGHLDADGDWSP